MWINMREPEQKSKVLVTLYTGRIQDVGYKYRMRRAMLSRSHWIGPEGKCLSTQILWFHGRSQTGPREN